MIEAPGKRPMRLWLVAILDIVFGTTSVFALIFLDTSARIPEVLRPSSTTIVLSVVTASFLAVAPVLALRGKVYGYYLTLVAAIAFYGFIIAQNCAAFGYYHEQLGQSSSTSLIVNVVGAVIQLAINCWALLSTKARSYFARAVVTP